MQALSDPERLERGPALVAAHAPAAAADPRPGARRGRLVRAAHEEQVREGAPSDAGRRASGSARCARCWPRRRGSACWSASRSGCELAHELKPTTRRRRPDAMDIRFLGHAAFELTDGDTPRPDRPFLTGNPKAAVGADELEPDDDPAHARPRRPHRRHRRDRQAHRRARSWRSSSSPTSSARTASRTCATRTSAAPSSSTGAGSARARLAHLDDAEGHASTRPPG